MTETSVWIAAVVPVVAVLLTTLINNAYNSRMREGQNKHEERLKNLELVNAQKLRINEDKRSAYTEVLSQVGQAKQKHDEQLEAGQAAGKSSMTLYPTGLIVATSRAKLLLDPSRWEEFEDTLSAFYRSYYEQSLVAQKAFAKLFTEDLSNT